VALAVLGGAGSWGPVRAGEARLLAEDPVLEARLNRLAEELRCLVCQNESLAESRADLAQDLRREVRDLMRQGKTDPEVIEFLTARYGDFILYRPPFRPGTWPLWLGPPLIVLAAGGGLALYLRRRTRRPGANPHLATAASTRKDGDHG
jgi:cytochrome c-type biogenesis protein CcmH